MRSDSSANEERVLRVLDLLTAQPGLSQRNLAERAGVSLGLVNIILKRLARTGSIKTAQLTGRKVRYLLTPKGMAEKTRRTYTHVSRTLKVFELYQKRCHLLMTHLRESGFQQFAILGGNEIASLVELSLRNAEPAIRFRHVLNSQEKHPDELLLDCRLKKGASGPLGTSLLSKLRRPTIGAVALGNDSVDLAQALLSWETTPS